VHPELRRRLADLPERGLFLIARKRTVRGIKVGLVGHSGERREVLYGKLSAALDLLHQHVPRCLARLRSDTTSILLFGSTGALGGWLPGARLIRLNETYASAPSTSPADIASIILHEATHARLDRLGFEYRPERRARIEAVCFRRELAFARRLPDGEELAARARRQLMRDPAYWTSDAFRQRALAELRELQVPAWIVRALDRFSRRRTG
jgi:hypothetical protein